MQEMFRDSPTCYKIEKIVNQVIITHGCNAANLILDAGFDWGLLKNSWNILSPKERWLSLLAREFFLREFIGEIVASESYPYHSPKAEIVLRPGKRKYRLVPIKFTGKINKGDIINEQN